MIELITILIASLSVLTWNTHQLSQNTPLSQNKVVAYLAEQDADIVCLQEVEFPKYGKGVRMAELREVMKRYPYTYYDFKIYNSKRQYGNVVYSRYPLTNKQTLRYESRGNISSCCDVILPGDTLRLIVNYLETNHLHDSDLGDTITTSSLFAAVRKFAASEKKREAQAEVIRQTIDASDKKIIVVGDMNTIPMSPTYNLLSRGLTDCFRDANYLKWGGTCRLRGLWLRIDYIFVSKILRTRSCRVENDAQGSDHLPVVAELYW